MGDKLIDRLVELRFPSGDRRAPFQCRWDQLHRCGQLLCGAYRAVSHLIQLGYKRIGTITGLLNSTPGIDRMEGYRKAMTDHGLDVDESLIVEGDFTENSGYSAMKQLLQFKPDAIFAASDAHGDWCHQGGA